MKKVVEYKTNLSKKELKDLMKEVILEKDQYYIKHLIKYIKYLENERKKI